MKTALIIAALVGSMHFNPVYAQNIPKGFYAGASLSSLRSNIKLSGTNTSGLFVNTDCDATSVIAALVCDDDDSMVSGSVFAGRDAVLSFGKNSSVRIEAEFSFAGDSDFTTPSFPGPPGPAAFVYNTEVANLKTAFLNAYFDRAVTHKLTVFASTGVGASNFKLKTTDGVVQGNDSFTNISYNFGLGASYKLSNRINIFTQIRHIYHGKANMPLTGVVGGAPTGNYAVRLETNEARLGLMYKF
jgi:opacity protein-like surface antigen